MDEETKNGFHTKCGYAAVVGRPNAGKSTLLNRILGQKVAIVTPKPQTTRNKILAVHNFGSVQIVFLDTPGLHRPTGSLGRYMIGAAESAIADSNVCVWIIDTGEPKRPTGLTDEEKEIGNTLSKSSLPVIALLNKIDLLQNKAVLLPLIKETGSLPQVGEVIPISALNGDGIDAFLDRLSSFMPESPKLFPDDIISDRPDRFFVAEMIREALTDLTHMEVPYRSAVTIESYVEEMRRCVVQATIHVEKKSQRAIMVGSGGSMIKKIKERAQLAANEFLGRPIVIELHVKVSPGWSSSLQSIKKMGYE